MGRSWQAYVESLCADAWGMSAVGSEKVVEEIEVLIATDRLSESSVANVLTRAGIMGSGLEAAARSIQATVCEASSGWVQ